MGLFDRRPRKPSAQQLLSLLSEEADNAESWYLQSRDPQALDDAVAAWQRVWNHPALPTAPQDFQLAAYNNGAAVLIRRYQATHQLDDLSLAIWGLEQTVALTPDDAPDLPSHLYYLGIYLWNRYRHTHNLDDLNHAIEALQKSTTQTAASFPEQADAFEQLGTQLAFRHIHTRDRNDLDQAITVLQQAVAHAPIPQNPHAAPDVARCLHKLGLAYGIRYDAHTGAIEDLNLAVDELRRGIAHTPDHAPELPKYLHTLGRRLNERFEKVGRVDDIDNAVVAFQHAITRVPAGSTHVAEYLNSLGNALRDRYNHLGHVDDLDQAIEAFQQAVAQTSNLPRFLNNLGTGLMYRYHRLGKADDLRQAIETFQRALALPNDDSSEKAKILNNLGHGLQERYDRTGNLEDLNRTIDAFQQAADHTPDHLPDFPRHLSNLGTGLSVRYARTGSIEDQQRAVEVSRQAVDLTPEGSPDLPRHLMNLGGCLGERYARTGRLEDLQEAIERFRRGVAICPEYSPEFPALLNGLGRSLGNLYTRNGRLEELQQAIETFHRALAQTPEGSPDIPYRLDSLGAALVERYRHTDNLDDLNLAIDTLHKAVAHTPEDSPALPGYLNNLASGLKDRYARSANPDDRHQATAAYRKACLQGRDVALEAALIAARTWGDWALERQEWAEAIEAYGYGLAASERLFQGQLLRTSKEAWLREIRSLHAYTAYALARRGETGDLPRAVEVLEWGRARLLTQALERNQASLAQLESLAPDIYKQYATAAQRLETLEAQEMSGGLILPPGETLADVMRQARAQLDAAVQAIRHVPDYENFLQPPTFAQVQAALTCAPDADGEPEIDPLIYLAVTPAGALALIMPPIRLAQENGQAAVNRIIPLWLDHLTEMSLWEHVHGREDGPMPDSYIRAYARWWRAPSDQAARAAWFATLEETTRWLWEVVIGPLIAALTDHRWRRAVLIPQGWLGLLPLHAAWTEDGTWRSCDPEQGIVGPRGTGQARTYALDVVGFSYAPNARALQVARQRASRTMPHRLLAVYDPDGSLPNAALEAAAACEHFTDSQCQVLCGEAASAEAIRPLLGHYTVLHFACHGVAGFAQPLAGGLVLAYNTFLNLGEMFGLQLQEARLALLSACETGIPGTDLPDEVVSLPVGMLQAGVAGVVASLWAVNDLSTALLMERFYQLWQGEQWTPSMALWQAQSWLRQVTAGELAARFEQERKKPASAALISYDQASEAWQHFAYDFDAAAHPYAHPVYWAAFTLTGV